MLMHHLQASPFRPSITPSPFDSVNHSVQSVRGIGSEAVVHQSLTNGLQAPRVCGYSL